jgi:tRNA G18 (ribose-2'-O)-methylase SpoU
MPNVIREKEAESYVIIQNLQYSNIGSICRNCMAFNVKEVVVVGPRLSNSKLGPWITQ